MISFSKFFIKKKCKHCKTVLTVDDTSFVFDRQAFNIDGHGQYSKQAPCTHRPRQNAQEFWFAKRLKYAKYCNKCKILYLP